MQSVCKKEIKELKVRTVLSESAYFCATGTTVVSPA